jgi:hypothetical protein
MKAARRASRQGIEPDDDYANRRRDRQTRREGVGTPPSSRHGPASLSRATAISVVLNNSMNSSLTIDRMIMIS